MGRSPCCDENGLKKGPWTQEEDKKLIDHIQKHGHGSWRALPKQAGLKRCGKSCRLRWTNYLRPDIKRGNFTEDEEQTIINLHSLLGNKWSSIAGNLSGRTDNEIKNYWNTHLRKKLLQMGIDPVTHRPRTDHLNVLAALPQLIAAANFNSLLNYNQNVQLDATSLAKAQLLHNMIQLLSNNANPSSSSSTIQTNNNLFGQSFYSENQTLFGQSDQTLSQVLENNHDELLMVKNQSIDHHLDSFASPIQIDLQDDHNSLPLLIPASPEECKQQSEMMMKNKEVSNYHHHHDTSNHSSSNSTFTQDHHQPWCDTIDDEANDSYWKEIIEQTEPWPFPE